MKLNGIGRKALFATLLSAAALAANARPCAAIGISAWAGGRPQENSVACFGENFGTAVNVCTSSKQYEMSLPSNEGSRSVAVSASCPAGGPPTSCTAIGITQTGNTITASNTLNVPVCNGALQPFTLNNPAATVPHLGFLFLSCTVAPNGALRGVNYTQ